MVNRNPPVVCCKNRGIASEIEIGRSQRRQPEQRPVRSRAQASEAWGSRLTFIAVASD